MAVVGIIREYKASVKRKRKIVKLAVANYLIAKDALAKAGVTELEPREFVDAVNHLTDNTLDIILEACGTKYIEDADWQMKQYEESLNQKKDGSTV